MVSHTEKITASEHAYEQIKRMIANHKLSPGTPLVAQTLTNMFGMSRTPIIEALRRLERDGLVVTSPRWGTSVREWTWKEIFEAYRIRRALEGEAAALFVLYAEDAAKKRLVELADAFEKAVDDAAASPASRRLAAACPTPMTPRSRTGSPVSRTRSCFCRPLHCSSLAPHRFSSSPRLAAVV